MKEFSRIFLLGFVFFSLVQCGIKPTRSTSVYAEIIEEGFIDCYEAGLLTEKGKPLWCETSAVLFDQGRIFLGNDHQMPDQRSAVFSMEIKDENPIAFEQTDYSYHPLLKLGRKYEDFAVSPDGKTIFLITGFDRVKEDGSSDWDGYNGFYHWPSGEIEKVKVIQKNKDDSTSISLRNEFSKVLANKEFPLGMPYFKIEGLAVLENKILFGIREYGKNYNEFDYAAKIMSVSYKQKDEHIILKNDLKVISDLQPNRLNPKIKEELGLSSIEYNPQEKTFFLLTSFEDEQNNLGAYLWTASYQELKKNVMNPVLDENGNQIRFSHKAEDMTFIDQNTLFIIHDDDKEVTKIKNVLRKPHQAAYSLVRLKNQP